MNAPSTVARLLVGAALCACVSRAPLPPPRHPLVATPDEAFRAAPPPLGTAPEARSDAREDAVLSNGLRVAVLHRPEATVTELVLHNRRGGDESDALAPGLAYLATRVIERDVEESPHASSAAVGFGWWVAHGSAGLSADAHPGHLDDALASIADGLAATPPRERFAPTRDQIAERLLNLVGDDSVLRDLALSWTYASAIHGRPAYGRSADVRALRYDDVLAFIRARWVPTECVLVVAGRARLSDVLGPAEAAFASWRGAALAPPAPTPSLLRDGGQRVFVLEAGGAARARLFVSAPLRPASRRERVALRLFNVMLGETPGSRIYRALRTERGATYHVDSRLDVMPGALSLEVRGAVPHARAVESVRAILAQIEALRRAPASASEFERGRSLYDAWLREASSDDASSLASRIARGGDDDEHISAGEARATLAALTAEDVRAAASSRLDPARIRVVVRGDPVELGDSLAALGLGPVGYYHREY